VVEEGRRYNLAGRAKTIYVGGGSPSCLAVGELCRLIDYVGGLALREGVEFTVEMNPGQVDGGVLAELRGRGVNRVSFGAQSFDDEVLKLLGRRHGAAEVYRAVELARGAGFGNVSIDLIFAVPGQSMGSWESTLGEAIGLGVEHVSAYSLSFEAGTEFSRRLESGGMRRADEEVELGMYERAIDLLGAVGLRQYEVSNFARAGFECEHNGVYWANESYVGLGPSAGSYYGGKRTMNVADLREYVSKVKAGGDAFCEVVEKCGIEEARETAVLNLRRVGGIDYAEFLGRTGCDARELFGAVIDRYVGEGLMVADAAGVRLSGRGLYIADSIVCDFVG
jgi:oxygen-independent coproporphyrinogen-3 oxidase